MAKTGVTGLKRIFNAYKYSLQGFKSAWINEAAFRQELVVAIILTIITIVLPKLGYIDRLILLVMPWLVMVVEILNSSLEAVVDRIGDEWNELSGRAKDLGSAAVFLMISIAVVSWCVILFCNYVM